MSITSQSQTTKQILRKIWNDPIHLTLSLSLKIPWNPISRRVNSSLPVMNEKLPIEFRKRERGENSRNRFPRMDHGRVPSVSREPVHRYHWKTPVSLLFIFTNTSLEGTILAWRIRHVCRVLPFPRVASGGSRNIHASDANDRVELNPLPRIGRKWFRGEVVGFFESRKLVAPPAMIRHTHTYPDFRVLVRRARPSVATNALSWHSLSNG